MLIGGRNRVDGLVGVGHGVKKRLHGALDEVDERFFDGELGRSAQHGVLEDVEDARVVCRWGFEADGKRLVLILAGKEKQACSGCGVVDDVGLGVQLVDGFGAFDGKAAHCGAGDEDLGSALASAH